MDLKGKVCIVTGGASGIGKAICQRMLSMGAKVNVCDINTEAGQDVVKALNAKYGSKSAIFSKCDVRDLDSVRDSFKKAKHEFGNVDVIFNNAGIWDDSPASWSREVDINFKGVVNGCIVGMEVMGKASGGNGGTIVNTASVLGLLTLPMMPIYSATKSAVIALTRCFGTDFHFEMNGIRFMSLCPWGTDTLLFEKLREGFLMANDELVEYFKEVTSKTPLQTPENVAECVVNMLNNGKNGSTWLVGFGDSGFEVTIKENLLDTKEITVTVSPKE